QDLLTGFQTCALPISRTGRSCRPRASSFSLAYKVDENIFQRGLRGVQVAEADARLAHVVEQAGDAGALGARVIMVNQLRAVGAERQVIGGELRRHGFELAVEL